MNQKRNWHAVLQERRRHWLALLLNDQPVKDHFQLRDKTAVVRLKPYDASNTPLLTEQLDAFVDQLDEMSRQEEGVSPANPIRVEPDENPSSRFYGDAYLLGIGADEPPDGDGWIGGVSIHPG